ncbi:MLX-interacting protein isoform X2 [Anoplophora glabripennis]|uniref:MLX-interacting protein isoform X2 n=1 Tax=Anoplophora glabripennis TaxID=217634 RepID=UPI000873B755|nr:MLX-interacting protein isoform X2 [Anoplophora glabripennis]
MYTIQHVQRPEKPEKESIHSGHFMVSHFEAEEQDDEDNVAIPIPEVTDTKAIVQVRSQKQGSLIDYVENKKNQQQLAIDTSLSKLFQCMSLAYRQKLTSPKWNRFRGIRLRWKDKIRLNNVIWRCWHLQFIKKENTFVCQFASPLDVDTHNKPEAVVLEGKYWKRKLAAVTAEYKRWRMFYRNNLLGHMARDATDTLSDVDLLVWDSNSSDNMNMMVDEDYMGLMSDTLFSTITNQPFVFPDSREIAKAGLADFIQPSLGPLQPNLDDYMDTLDPLQELISSRLPTVPEENQSTQQTQQLTWGYIDSSMSSATTNLQVPTLSSSPQINQYQLQQIQQMPVEKQVPIQDTRQQNIQASYSDMILQQPIEQYVTHQSQPPPYSSVISKNTKSMKNVSQSRGKLQQNIQTVYSKSMDNIYPSYSQQSVSNQILVSDRICLPMQELKDAVESQQQNQQAQQLQEQQQQQFQKLVQASHESRQVQGYKFSVPTTPNIKFTSPQQLKDEKPDLRRRGAPRGRGRSRSNTREPQKRPPLISAISDPSLLTPQTSVLLTQLLTNSTEVNNSLYSQSQNMGSSQSNQIRIKEETNSVPILPQPPPTTLIIPSQVSINTIQPTTSDPLSLSSPFSNCESPVLDPTSQNLHSPTSSQGSMGSPNRESSHRDRRAGHIHAEQKRRYNIKNGFDMIHSLIPHLNQNPNAKLSKAAMLQKGAEYIRQLKLERNQLKEEMISLRQQIETLNTSISNCQSMLPATGAPVSRRRDSKMQEMFDEYIKTRTRENWKFWIFSLIFKPLLNSFNNFVSTSSLDDLYSSTLLWIEQHCTLMDLRPVVLNSLRYLCTKTDILSEPEKLPDEARKIVLSSNLPQSK